MIPANFNYKSALASIYTALICFLTYACVYAFRKPFTIGLYLNQPLFLGIDFKNCLVISQVLGYTFSKFYGVKYVSELKKIGRGKAIVVLLLLSWFPLFLFPLIPAPLNIACLFLNGLPLGIIWGIVFSFAEGRRGTDFIGATLAVSFIVSSGLVKSVAKWLELFFQLNEMWIPFYTGLLFIIPVILLVFLLDRIPPPSKEEIELKSVRLPMTGMERKSFFIQFKFGLISFIFIYTILTLFRDIRDNFAADIWKDLGFVNDASIFTSTELTIAIIVLVLIASMIFIKNNNTVFIISQCLIVLGFLMAGISTYLFQQHFISGFNWMLLVGLGLYMGYIPFNSILFDRMIATFKLKGNVGYFMYMMDSFGYLASVIVISFKGAFHIKMNWLGFYGNGVLWFSILGAILSIITLIYFIKKSKQIVIYE